MACSSHRDAHVELQFLDFSHLVVGLWQRGCETAARNVRVLDPLPAPDSKLVRPFDNDLNVLITSRSPRRAKKLGASGQMPSQTDPRFDRASSIFGQPQQVARIYIEAHLDVVGTSISDVRQNQHAPVFRHHRWINPLSAEICLLLEEQLMVVQMPTNSLRASNASSRQGYREGNPVFGLKRRKELQ